MGLLRVDERKLHRLVSRAKKAVAFFNNSRSCRRSSFFSKTGKLLVHVLMGPESKSFSAILRRQRSSVDLPMPRSLATDEMLRPLVVKIRTASRLNSSVNSRRFNFKSPVSLI